MASKKTFLNDLETSPTAKFISTANQELTEVKEEIEQPNGEKVLIGQTAFNLEQPKATSNQDTPKPKGNINKKDVNQVKGQRFSLLLTIPQRESLEHIAIVKGVSINELIGQFINDGINNNKDDLEKWEKLKEVLGL